MHNANTIIEQDRFVTIYEAKLTWINAANKYKLVKSGVNEDLSPP